MVKNHLISSDVIYGQSPILILIRPFLALNHREKYFCLRLKVGFINDIVHEMVFSCKRITGICNWKYIHYLPVLLENSTIFSTNHNTSLKSQQQSCPVIGWKSTTVSTLFTCVVGKRCNRLYRVNISARPPLQNPLKWQRPSFQAEKEPKKIEKTFKSFTINPH